MGWVEKRIKAIQKGKKMRWIEKRMLEHANPVHLFLLLIAAMFLITGLWEHDWMYTGIGVVVVLLGHVWCWTRK